MPIAAFAGTIYVINRLTSESELVVVQATGFSPWRLLRPVLMFGVLVLILSSILGHILVPTSQRQLAIRSAEVSENMTARLLSEGRFLHPADNVTFYIREISPQGQLQNVFLSDTREAKQHVTYTATEALLVRGETAPSLILLDGMAQTYAPDTRSLAVTRFETFAFDLSGLIDEVASRRTRPRELGTLELLEASPETQALAGSSRSKLVAEAHERFGNALNGLIAPLVAFSTLLIGGFSRFGIWRQILGAIALLIVVQMLTQAGQGMVQGNANVWPAAYLGPLFGALVSIFMLFLASNPALFKRRSPPLGSGP